MDRITLNALQGAAGVAGVDPVYVDDVFSTYLYEGNNTTGRDIVNGIDLAGKGGLVWIKKRNVQRFHVLVDTERGANKVLETDTQAGTNNSGLVTGFNSDGFEVDNHQNVNAAASGSEGDPEYVSWTFRKAPGFFDVVTYTGTGSAQDIPHSLGSVPGMVVIKYLSYSGNDWAVYHKSTGATKHLHLNNAESVDTGTSFWNDTAPTSTHFTVGSHSDVNDSGADYVAYIFAHDDQRFGTDEDESIIKCGTFEASVGTEVNLGFEPQFLLIKTIDSLRGWFLIDNMRGVSHDYVVNSNFLSANSDADEDDNRNIFITPTGFEVCSSTAFADNTNIYMAIRRGPMKTPEAATEVFDLKASTGDFSGSLTSTSVLADVVLSFGNPSSGDIEKYWMHRQNYVMLIPHTTTSSTTGLNDWSFDHNAGAIHTGYWGNGSAIDYTFRRAPGFFDVVFYPGDGGAHDSEPNTINHNLGVSPEIIIIKRLNGYVDWKVWTAYTGTYLGTFNTSAAFGSDFQIKNATTTTFDVGTDGAFEHTNVGTGHHIAYLFASLAGVSKVGTYDGTGSDLNVDCGFTAGARFVMIKRTDSTGDWLYWDTIRGIVSGNESAFPLNGTVHENQSWSPGAGNWGVDWLDPLSTGFTVTSSAPAAANASGGTYIYLAIA